MSKQIPYVIAHTGCMGTPSNSLLSVRTGLALGADVIEDDIRVTADGIAVLAHDDAIRTADGTVYSIRQTAYDELSRLEFITDDAIPQRVQITALEELLLLVRDAGKLANLDVKANESLEAAATLVRKLHMLEQVWLSGCRYDRAMLAQEQTPELKKLLNVNEHWFAALDYQEAVERSCGEALEAHCMGININYELCRPQLIAAANNRGLDVYIWTVNKEEDMKSFLLQGVRSITTQNVGALIGLRATNICLK